MTGLDTNILVRFLTQDDAAQCAIANRIMERDLTRESPGFINVITLVETAWVLESQYGLSRAELAAILEGLIRLDNVVVQHRGHAMRAIDELRIGRADFSDVLIGALCEDAGCTSTITFDRRAARLPGFSLAT
jgi:predicted nucleic-acid-binding protein